MSEYPMDTSCSSCIIRTHPLFRHLGEEELQDISLNKITETYKRGSIVYREGNRMKGFYCVQSGIVKIYKTGFDGKEQIVRFAKPGDLIGYRSVVSNEAACTTAELLQDGTLCHIPTDILFHLVKTNGNFAVELMKLTCKELGEANAYIMDVWNRKTWLRKKQQSMTGLNRHSHLTNCAANNLRRFLWMNISIKCIWYSMPVSSPF